MWRYPNCNYTIIYNNYLEKMKNKKDETKFPENTKPPNKKETAIESTTLSSISVTERGRNDTTFHSMYSFYGFHCRIE